MSRWRVVVCGVVACVSLATSVRAGQADDWRATVTEHLCRTYADADREGAAMPEGPGCLQPIAEAIGRRLAASGPAGVPAEDVAALALLMSQRAPAAPLQTVPAPAGAVAVGSPEPDAPEPDADPTQLSDIGKGQEGFRQGVERLEELPVTERMVVTGDITSGFQAATVTDAPELTSAFGRARVNFVTRAVPASRDGALSEGYFFVQMIAAGGAVDASPLGGPVALSPLNDVATDRSAFNQGASRGNLYLKKAFYQQELALGERGSLLGRVGIISLSDLFDTSEFANNEARQFLNAAFVNSAAYKAGVALPGFMAEYRRTVDLPLVDELTVRTGYGVTRTFRAFTSPLWTSEVAARVTLRGRPGTYRLGSTLGNVPDAGGVHGWHIGFDQWLGDDLGVFGRYARSNRGPGSLALGPVGQSYSAGAQWRIIDERDRVSAWGLGFSQAFPIASPGTSVSERIIETYYRREFTDNLSLTPDVQVIFGAGGRPAGGTHVVGSLRVNVGF